jgi:hypothetical protein
MTLPGLADLVHVGRARMFTMSTRSRSTMCRPDQRAAVKRISSMKISKET